MIKIKVILLFFLLGSTAAQAISEVKNPDFFFQAGKLYCQYSHPVEWWKKSNYKKENSRARRTSTCEKQHVIQQQYGGSNELNTVWWPASHHNRTDNWRERPWQSKKPFWLDAGFTGDSSDALYSAYMMGTWGISYSAFISDYNGKNSAFIPLKFDGVSNALYYIAWVINIPQKFIHQIAYILDGDDYVLFYDLIIQVFVTLLEVVLGLWVSVFGVVVGTILNPIDTLAAIPGGIFLFFDTILTAIWNIITGILAVVMSIFGKTF